MRKNLKHARLAKGLTQKQTAAALGMKYNTYRSYEYGRSNAPPEKWDTMEDFFGIPQRVLRKVFLDEHRPACGQTLKKKKDQSEKVLQADSLQSEE